MCRQDSDGQSNDEAATSELEAREVSRNNILDCAEALFAQQGYAGTSLRDIAQAAEVLMGLVHYYFSAKHLILAATVERKLELLRNTVLESFDKFLGTSGSLSFEEIVAAFIQPFLRAASSRDDPLRSYIIMTSHLMTSYRLPEIRPILARLGTVSGILTDELRRHCPELAQEDMLSGVYLLEAVLIFMVQLLASLMT